MYGLNLLLAQQMNAVYALLITLIVCLTGSSSSSHGYLSTAAQLNSGMSWSKNGHLASNRHLKIKTTETNQFSSDADASFISDNNDLSDTDQSLVTRAIILCVFYFFVLCSVGGSKQQLPFCGFLSYLASYKYLFLRSLRI